MQKHLANPLREQIQPGASLYGAFEPLLKRVEWGDSSVLICLLGVFTQTLVAYTELCRIYVIMAKIAHQDDHNNAYQAHLASYMNTAKAMHNTMTGHIQLIKDRIEEIAQERLKAVKSVERATGPFWNLEVKDEYTGHTRTYDVTGASEEKQHAKYRTEYTIALRAHIQRCFQNTACVIKLQWEPQLVRAQELLSPKLPLHAPLINVMISKKYARVLTE